MSRDRKRDAVEPEEAPPVPRTTPDEPPAAGKSAEAILASAKAILEKETASMKQILAGTVDRAWVDKALKEKGYKI